MFPDWMVFYDDGSTFSSEQGMPWEAPAVGVLILLQVDGNGKWVQYMQQTAYCWEWRTLGEWVPCDAIGVMDYMFHHEGPKAVLFGRWTSDTNYERIRRRADRMWLDIGRQRKGQTNG